MARNNQKDEKSPPKPAAPEKPVPLQPAGEVVVTPEPCAPKAPPGKTIHPRRPLPPVPEKDVEKTSTDDD
jgi:hypothetical protein